jgi:putative membrane protein
MTDTVTPQTTDSAPQPNDGAGAPPVQQEPAPAQRAPRTRTGSVRIALIAGTVVLAVVLIFILQNTSAVSINFLGAHLHVSLAVAMLLAAIAGALILAAAGTARITQLRKHMRRDLRRSKTN